MQSLSVRVLLSLFALLILAPAALAHDVTVTGTQSFSSLDGSASDHDGTVNGVFTVSDGNLVISGVVNCNDDGGGDNACAMAFAVSGNMTVGTGGALYAENRTGAGTGGAITLTVGGHLTTSGDAIVSTASKSSSGSTGGAITANVSGNIALGAGTTIDSGSANARGGNISLAAAGLVTVDGNVLSGPSRTLLATRLTGVALDGGSGNQIGGQITISSNTFAEPAVVVSSTANVISQGADGGAGPVTVDGCGVQVRGLVAALARKDSATKVSIRSGKDVVVDGRDLGASGTRMGRVRSDSIPGTALNRGVDIFAAETIQLFGPSGSLFLITAHPGVHDSKSYGGLIRITSLGDAVSGSGNVIDAGHTASGDTGGTVEINAKANVSLNTAVIRTIGDFSTNNPNRGGGSISIRSYSGDVLWTNGLGEVRPIGSSSGLPLADQGRIVLTACGTVDTTGSSFPVMGTATGVFPETHTGVCSPAAPSLPTGVAPLITCNTPPAANDTTASTNEDTTVTVTLSGTDADGDSLTFSIVSGPANGALGPVISTGPTTATVDYTPSLNFNGTDSFVFQANDGNGGTDNATAVITVAPVNDPPSFLVGPTVTVLEDSGAQTYPNWVTAISAGPADEAGQTVTFTVTNDNPSLFSVQPAVAPNGTLTFTPAANAYGSATITVVAQDNGGTANGGNDTSAAQTSSITVTPVNDEPSFTGGGNVSVLEDSGAYSAAWASSISAGPNESGQTVSFVVGNDNNALFSVQPAVSSSGTLTFTTAADANGSATVTVFAQDNGGTANGGDDTSPAQTFTITVGAVNDAPSFTGGGNVTVDEDSGAYSAAWATSISAGPADESGQTVTFSASNNNNALFSVQPSISSAGVLTFTVAANAFGSATVTVTLSDNGGTANGGADTSAPQTFTINVSAVNDEPSFTAGGDVSVLEDSGAYSAAWASSISAGPNESGQTLTFVVSNDNNGLFSTQPSISPSGVLTFTPAANAFGTATVSVQLMDDGGTANGGDDTSPTATFTITVDGVNDAPSFTSGGNVTVLEDSGAYSAAWATAVSAGPANESGQTVSFVVTGNSNPSLFSVAPAVAANGTLTFTVAANAFGSATITLHAQDDGGTANGGVDTSAAVTFTITVDGVNDAPSFTPGGNVTVNEDSGAYSAAWATAISAGPNESGQTVSFNVSNSNNALFSAQPSISASGALTFTPAPNAFGTVTVTVSLSDNGGTANGGVDSSASVTFTITVNAVNDPPVAGADAWATFGNTELRVDNGPVATPHVLATTPSGTGVLHNDSDPVEGDPITITGVVGCADATAPFDCTLAGGAKLSLNANGSFTFTPGPGVVGGSFQYTVSDGTDSATGTVTITTSEMIWYVNGSAAAGGNGTSNAPFNSFASLSAPTGVGDVDAPGAYIFVHNSTVNGSMFMEAGQHLLGEGVGLTIGATTLVPAGTKPVVVSGASDSVTVDGVTGVEIAGLSLNSTTGDGIDVSSITGADASVNIHDNVVSAGPAGIRIDGSAGGNLHVTGLSNVTVAGSTTGDGILVTAATFDGVAGGAFNTVGGGAIAVGASGSPVGGRGVVFTNVSGDYAIGTLSVYGGSSAVTVTGSGLYTGSTGMRLTTGGGALNAPVGVGLSVTNATIGAAGLNFTSINSTNAVNGIILNNTGTSGGLSVTGSGTTDGSGGSLTNLTGDAVLLTSTAKVSLANVIIGDAGATDTQNADAINNIGGDGIDATNVTPGPGTYGLSLENVKIARVAGHGVSGNGGNVGFRMSNSEILNAGDAISEHAINFGSGFATNATMLAGTVDIANSVIAAAANHGFFVENSGGGTLNMTVSGSTFKNNDDALFCVTTCEGSGIVVIADGSPGPGTPTINLTVQNTTFTEIDQDGIEAVSDPGGVIDLNVVGTTHNSPKGDNALRLANGSPGDDSTMTFDIADLTVQAMRGTIVSVRSAGTMEGRITTQSLAQNVLTGGAGNIGRGIEIVGDGDSVETPRMTILVENTKIRSVGSDGMLIDGSDVVDPSSFMNVTVRNNVIGEVGGEVGTSLSAEGIEVRARAVFTLTTSFENNSVRTAGTSSTSEAIDLDAENSARLVASVSGNQLVTASVTTNAFRADTESATSSFCLDLNAANTNPNTAPGGYAITRFAGSAFEVEGLAGASNGATTAAFLQARNSGTVTANDGGGTFTASSGCANPPLPANP